MRDDLFVCVHEQFITDTAKYADIVLPATTFLEHDDMYRAGGHSYFQVTRKVIEPYAESRENHYVVCELARRLGAEHRGFTLSAWELIDESLRMSGYPAIGPDGIIGKGNMHLQTLTALDYVKRTVEAAGAKWSDVVHMTFYFTDRDKWHREAIPARVEFFAKHSPDGELPCIT